MCRFQLNSLLLLLLLAAAILLCAGSQESDEHEEIPDDDCEDGLPCAASWLQLNAGRRSLDRLLGVAGPLTSDAEGFTCPRDTGASCTVWSCHKSRGEIDCVRGRCICKPGYCNQGGVCVLEHPDDSNEQQLPPTCIAKTDHTCIFRNCSELYGPSECSGYLVKKCVCLLGYCKIHGVCHPDRGNFLAGVFPVSAQHPEFPGKQASLSTGIALSGGGGRACVFSAGILRALEHLGVLAGVDIISSASGGSWAAAIYMFADVDAKTLLGAPSQPSELTMDLLRQRPAPLLAAATTSTTAILLQLLQRGVNTHQLWVQIIGQAFLEPFGLHDVDSFMAPDSETVARIKRDNPQLQSARFITPAKGRPKSLVMCGSLLAPTGYLASKDDVVSLQMSPDYIGSPFYPDNKTVSYQPQSGRFGEALENQIVGGGFVESFAFGGQSPGTSGQRGGSNVSMFAPREAFSLSKALAVSSAGPASALTQVGPHGAINVGKLSMRADYWPLTSEELPGPQRASSFLLGDGGNIDNSGLLALLQRGLRRIVWVISTGREIPKDVNLCNLTVVDSSLAKQLENQLRAAFGHWQEDDLGEFLSRNQVFKKEDLLPVLCELQKHRDSGRPTVTSKLLAVQPNDWWGIRGGFEAKIVFIYLDKCADFVQKLPEETAQELQQGSAFKRFPHYLPAFQNLGEATGLSTEQVNLLSAFGEYFVHQNVALMTDLLQVSVP